MRTLVLPVLLLGAGVLAACSSDDTTNDRTNVPLGDGGASSSGSSSGDAQADPKGGRDESTPSCFAACQNVSFSCQGKVGSATRITQAETTLDETGCAGSMTHEGTTVALKLDCAARTVCVGTAAGASATSCAPGTFSAFNFEYTPPGGSSTICTREQNP